ncbi:MAG: SDR family NAD(P)-dependent oxidoreductase, partial [Calditrichaeota bacterium]|nr:SDR family NAD(P)-dependent oxidoreductase [Calditrichota bacterium]
ADLGIDTVKQAEVFAAIREIYGIPRDENLKLRDFPTLAHTIEFVYSKRPDLRSGAAPVGEQAEAAAPAQPEIAAPKFRGDLQASAAIPRRVPVPFLRPELTLCKASGVTLTTGSRVVVMPDQGGVGKALIKRLEKLGAEVLVIEDVPTGEELVKRLEAWKAQGEIQGVFWLAALDEEAPVENMKLTDWKAATHLRVKLLYHTMRTLYGHINQPGTFLVSATRLGGRHGYDAAGAVAPLGGAVSGFTKAYKREQPEVLVKVVDFAPSRKTAQLADLLIEETLLDPGVVEVGYAEERRWTVGLAEMPAEDGRPGMTLGRETVFLITGAAGSIVSAITADLADASGGVFHLLDLAPRPDPGNPDLVRFANDKENLKKDIFQRLKDSGQRATPAMVEKELASLERQYAALSAIRAVEQAGGSAHYYSVNLLDGAAMDAVMSQVRQTSGRIDVLLHAGGLEISRLLPDKAPGEFDLVFDVKSDGWFNLLSNLGDMPLGAAVVFSSIAGRFGNGGQTDYSSANDLLCKSISAFRRNRPDTRGIALDWTAWGGIGMAARGSIPAIMKAAGIDMLPPEAGIAFIRRELSAGGTRQEVVVAQGLGMMLNEFDESGGLDLGENSELARQAGTQGIMNDRVVGMGLYSGLTIEKTLDPSEQPFLYDHQIDGTPVLPGVMGIEALSEAARLLFPDRHLAAVEEVNFLAPFKFYRNEPRTVTVQANFSLDGEDIVADCRLLGTRQLHGQAAPQVSTHFTARVRLSATAPEKAKYPLPAPMNGKSVEAEDIYRLYFHGPAYRVLERAWRSGGQVMGAFAEDLPENHRPVERITLASPRLIELCFQTAGIWEMGSKSRMGLPHGIRRVEFHGDPAAAKGRLHAAVTPNPDGSFDARVIDGKGNHFLTLAGYHTSELPDPIAEDILSPLKQIVD